MNILIDNVFWMTFNGMLALIPVFLSWGFLKTKKKFFRVICLFLWLIYLPNTLYLFTDLIHLSRQWLRVEDSDKIILLFQYFALETVGLITFMLAVAPFERFLFTSKWRKEKKLNCTLILLVNLSIGFGIVLGRVERINSWEILTAPMKVADSVFQIIGSVELIFMALLFGLFANALYFIFRKPFLKFTQRIDK